MQYRDALVEFVTDAIWSAGLFGGVYNKKPALSRWGTLTGACGANSAAKMCYGIGGRALLKTWPDAVKPLPIGAHADNDYHFTMKSKLHRVIKKQGNVVQDLKFCSVSFCATTLDHLLQRIQKPSKQGILMDLLATETNPFIQCQLDLGDVICLWPY